MVLTKVDVYLTLAVIVTLFSVGLWKNKLPSTSSISSIIAMIDSKGGNIIVLGSFTLYFFHRTELLYYSVMNLVQHEMLKADNGVALNGLLFCTGAFGGFSGALLKVMSGSEPTQPSTTKTTSTTTTGPSPDKVQDKVPDPDKVTDPPKPVIT